MKFLALAAGTVYEGQSMCSLLVGEYVRLDRITERFINCDYKDADGIVMTYAGNRNKRFMVKRV